MMGTGKRETSLFMYILPFVNFEINFTAKTLCTCLLFCVFSNILPIVAQSDHQKVKGNHNQRQKQKQTTQDKVKTDYEENKGLVLYRLLFPDDKLLLNFQFFANYTVPFKSIPRRHTYLWNDFSFQYFLNKNTSFANLLRVYKVSLSESLTAFPFQVAFFPTLLFRGSLAEIVLKEKNSILGENEFDIKVGSILGYTPSKGLIFSEFTGLGVDLDWVTQWGAVEFSYISYGYHAFDDVVSMYFYTPKQYFGIGVLSEFNTLFIGARFIPEINFEFQKRIDHWNFRIFGELGINYLTNTRLKQAMWYQYFRVGLLTSGFKVDANTLLGLTGFDVKYQNKKWGSLTVFLRGEYRYYGRDFGNFYFEPRSGFTVEGSLSGRRTGFEFYTDIRSDEKHNNQPYNFILRRGYNQGIYVRTEFNMNPFYRTSSKWNLNVRNELLLIFNTQFDFRGNEFLRLFQNDIFALTLSYNTWRTFTINARLSNILIGRYEVTQPSYFLLPSNDNLLLDIYLSFKI